MTFLNAKGDEKFIFEISERRNDLEKLYEFLLSDTHWLVGYNSYSYDSNIIIYIINNYNILTLYSCIDITTTLYNLSTILITDNFRKVYIDKFIDIDLMKVGGFYKSLKLVGVSLKWKRLQDLPLPPDESVKTEDMDEVIEYNLNDVLITKRLYEELLPEIKMRYEISKRFNIRAYSESRSGLANRLLEKFYHETTGVPIREFKKLRTERRYIRYSDIILPNVKFATNTFTELLDEMKGIIYYKEYPFFKKKVVFDGVTYRLGIGGLHSDDKPGVFESNVKQDIVDADVGSYYPSLIIEYNISPQHLAKQFLHKYRELRDMRLKAKHEGDMAVSDALKISLNATFGKMLNENHWLYDMAAGLKITVNGQLFLLMLVERLVLAGFEVISANTDGVLAIIPKDKATKYEDICHQWEQETGMTLEFTYYSKYIRKDVNNYIAVKKGSIKFKGDFDPNINLYKGYDKPIVAKALYAYFIDGIEPEEFIKGHKDMLDFCAAYKIDEKFENIYMYVKDGTVVEEKLQRSVRYYVSNSTNTLFKRDTKGGKEIRYESEHSVTVVNDYVGQEFDINYGYYITQVRKIIDEIINPQLTLWS